jgi:hypothetical protein
MGASYLGMASTRGKANYHAIKGVAYDGMKSEAASIGASLPPERSKYKIGLRISVYVYGMQFTMCTVFGNSVALPLRCQ